MTDRVDRPSARVIVVDETENVLLFRIVDALDPKPPVWITPGGGIESGETLAVAAARELREETGIVVEPTALGAPVAVCRGDWEFRGAPLYSVDCSSHCVLQDSNRPTRGGKISNGSCMLPGDGGP